MIVAPSILAADFARLGDDSERMLAATKDYKTWLHIDVMDGRFVPNLSLGPPVIKALRRHLPDPFFDVHCMVCDPEHWIKPLLNAGANSYTFHWEAVESDLRRGEQIVDAILAHGMQAGLAFKPSTPIDSAIPLLKTGKIGNLLIMTVDPGFGGQPFMESVMPKVSQARQLFPEMNIQVDGGINDKTAEIAARNGASVFVAGSYLFGSNDYRKVATDLINSVERGILARNT